MKKKSRKSSHTPNKIKSTKYNLRNKSLISNEKINIEKLLDDMQKDLINEITKLAQDKINEHKDIIIKAINDIQFNQSNANQKEKEKEKEDKNVTIFPNSIKKRRANSVNRKNVEEKKDKKNKASINKKSNNKNVNKTITKKSTKSKKKSNIKNKSKNKKKINKNESVIKIGSDKTEASSLNDISKISIAVPNVNKLNKNVNEKSVKDNTLLGKKRKRKNDNSLVLYLNSEPNCKIQNKEKNAKKILDRKKSKSTKKLN